MLCERAQELFSDYYEGSIQAALTIPLEDHLGACGSCRDEFDGLKRIWPVLDAAPVIEPPADFRALVWQRIDAAEAERATVRKPLFRFDWQALFPKPALGWAAALLVVIALSGVAVKGNFTPAWIGSIWSSKPAPSPSIGSARTFEVDGNEVMKVYVQNPASYAIRVNVEVTAGSMDGLQPSFVVPAGATGWFPVGTLKPGDSTPTRINTSWRIAN
jgi:hypothetical protein